VPARLGDLEPRADGAARHRVLLDAELRDEEAVDHVLGLEVDEHDLVDGHVHLVEEDLVGARVLDLPVELLRRHLDDEVAGRLAHLDPRPCGRGQGREHDEDERGDDGPHDLQRRVAMRVARPAARPVPGTTATQPSIHEWTSQVSLMTSGFSNFSVIVFLNFGCALLMAGFAVEYVWMLCRMSSEFLSSSSPGAITVTCGTNLQPCWS